MNRPRSPCAFLIALLVTGTIVCGLCYFRLASIANSFIYFPMLPTITATPPSGDTYLHPLRPTRQTDLILGPMLSPELKSVVRGALSLLRVCSPETWSSVLQYAYAINAPPTPQMNYHMIR